MSVDLCAMKTVTFYTKLGCHLCEDVERTIAIVAKGRGRFDLVRRDIAEDAGDHERYKDDVPVVLVDGVEIARHGMTARQLIQALRE